MLWQGCSGQRGSPLCRVWAAATQGHLLLAVTLLRSKGGAGRGKTWAGPEQDGRRQLTPHLCSRDALSLAGLSRRRVQARSHLLSWLWGWKNKKSFSLKERNHVVNKQGVLEIGRRNRRRFLSCCSCPSPLAPKDTCCSDSIWVTPAPQDRMSPPGQAGAGGSP